MRSRVLIAISSLVVLMMVGCGSSAKRDLSSSDNQSLQEPIIPTATKFTKANWEGVQPLAEGFFVTDDGNLLSFKVADENIANGNVRAMGVFIDADNNPNTGYRRDWLDGGSIGADYLVGDHGIYSYGGEGWNWNFIQTISRTPMNGNELEFEFPRNLIQTDGNIRVLANLADQNWNVIKVTEPVNYTLSDNGGDNGDDIDSYNIVDNGDVLTITLHSPLIANNSVKTQQLFIDADNNPNTGYRHRTWSNNIGVEYLIEGNHLYRYRGWYNGHDSNWDWWEWVRDIPRDVHNDTITLTLQKNQYNLNNQIRTIAGLRDQNWHMVHMYSILDTNIDLSNDHITIYRADELLYKMYPYINGTSGNALLVIPNRNDVIVNINDEMMTGALEIYHYQNASLIKRDTIYHRTPPEYPLDHLVMLNDNILEYDMKKMIPSQEAEGLYDLVHIRVRYDIANLREISNERLEVIEKNVHF